MKRVVVVGASLAGLRTAENLRRLGYAGELVLVGDEPDLPYDRPPLSKALIEGTATRSDLDLPIAADLDLTWRLGTRATGLDPARRRVWLEGGQRMDYDGLVIATGAGARGWPGGGPPGLLTLRTAGDGAALSAAMAGAHRVLVIGAGFLGGEVAAAARRRGLDVTLVEPAPLPLATIGGVHLGEFVAALHRHAGVDLRLASRVTALTVGPDGLVAGGRLGDGTEVSADVVVAALGAVANTGWLAGAGIQLDRGVVCDPWCRPLSTGGSPVPGVVAAGDVTRSPHVLAGGPVSLGHWSNAVDQAETAARTLLHPDRPPPRPRVPSFWSDLHGVPLRSVGLPHRADEYRLVEHDPVRRRLVLEARRDGRLVGAVTANRTSRLGAYNAALLEELGAAVLV